jgi:hypothetical protein
MKPNHELIKKCQGLRTKRTRMTLPTSRSFFSYNDRTIKIVYLFHSRQTYCEILQLYFLIIFSCFIAITAILFTSYLRPVFRIRIDYMRIRIRIRIQHLDECGSGYEAGSSADPDSGKIWTKFSEGKRIIFFSLIFLTFNIFRPNSLPKIRLQGNTNFHILFWSSDLIFLFFWADFLPSGSVFMSPLNADPDPKLSQTYRSLV